ncbi:melatonin-related receptor-like isoform x4 [Plakobranchus ocellatus]|uniref:Melatonin-related receptor-like isoform x4 n=1 Tax=Plakobranchus ocellatus TaxID=259542 RepID=A0AAV3XV98_9GAST|nr:melatonin-related receptor-like isoform x4 [Plakobranchus ocellatus]
MNESVSYNISSPTSATTTPDNTKEWSRPFSSTIAGILIAAALVAVIGNLMVLAVIIRHRGMRTRTNLFLVNLAAADLLVGLLVMPFSITTMISHGWVFGDDTDVICQFNGWMNSFCLITSIHTLMYIGIHKYFSIVHPLSKAFQLRTILLMMFMAWLWAGVCSSLNLIGLKITYKNGTSQCGPNYPNTATSYIIHVILQLTVMIIPFGIMVFCYSRMFIEIKKHSARLRKNSTVEEEYILATQKKVAVTLFIVLATFFMMVLPYVSYATYAAVKVDKDFSPEINPVAYMFLYLNSMVNPIIYAFRSPAFREGYKEILCQTPNYVISDDSDLMPRTSRLASLVSNLRRGSNASASRLSAVLAGADSSQDLSSPELKKAGKVSSTPVTPTNLLSSEILASKRANLKKTRRKSLFDLLKATRQSNAQSVVHRNGDMIIMKGGKIVSVHRQTKPKDSNVLLDQLTKLAKTTSNTERFAVPGTREVCASDKTIEPRFDIVPEDSSRKFLNDVEREEATGREDLKTSLATEKDGSKATLNTNSEFCYDPAAVTKADDKTPGQNMDLNPAEDYRHRNGIPVDQVTAAFSDDHFDTKINWEKANGGANQAEISARLSEQSSLDSQPLAQNSPCAKTSQTATNKTVAKSLERDERDSNSSLKSGASTPALFINLDEDDHVTGVIPLSPVTRQQLERTVSFKDPNTHSDPDLLISLHHDLSGLCHYERHRNKQGQAMPSRHNRLSSGASAISRSSEDVSTVGHRLLRLPSVEYLDPPSKMFASHSSSNLRLPSPKNLRKSASNVSATSRQSVKKRVASKLYLPSMRRLKKSETKDNSTKL